MGINFLGSVTTKDIKREKFKMNFIIWNVGLIVLYIIIGAALLLVEGYYNAEKVSTEAEIKQITENLKQEQEKVDQYYTIAYKLQAVDIIKSRNYLPTIVTDYISEKAGDKITISSYRFLDDGGFEINVQAADFTAGVKFWDSLLTDKEIVQALNLKGMTRSESEEESDRIRFQLSGQVNIDKLIELATNDSELN